MNKAIRKLFEDSGGTIEVCDVTNDEVLTYTEYFDPEKFTRLIVQECMDICEGLKDSDGQYCADAISKRFNV